jgi:predicted RNA polymerase sigma factor
VPILRALIGKSESQCRTLLGALLKATDDDAARIYGLIREAEDLSPADPQAWLYAAARRGGRSGAPRRENTGARLRRELGLDADLDSLFADPAATGVPLQ